MIYLNGYTLNFTNCDYPKCDNNFIEKIGCYGTGDGFTNIIKIIPRVDKSRLVLTPITNYKKCNTHCDYCLEKYFLENYKTGENYLQPISADEVIEKILLYKPSIVEITSGELLQEENTEELDKLFSMMEAIDPHNKIIFEITSNGKDINTIEKYFKYDRVQLQISIDEAEYNPRHITSHEIFYAIDTLSAISKDRLVLMWMLKPDYDSAFFKLKILPLIESGYKILVQPINTIDGYYETDKKYDLEFIERLLADWPTYFEYLFSYKNLLFPGITCLEGQIVCTTDGKVTTCRFNTNLYDNINDYDMVKESFSKLTTSAGVCHTCSYLSEYNMPSNYIDIQRFAYTSTALSIMYNFKGNNDILKHINNLYNEISSFYNIYNKDAEFVSPEDADIFVDLEYSRMTQYSFQSIIRILSLKSIDVKSINVLSNNMNLRNDGWSYCDNGVNVTACNLSDFITLANLKNIHNEYFAISSTGNFPARIWIIGKVKDILLALQGDKNIVTYPNNMRNYIGLIEEICYLI